MVVWRVGRGHCKNESAQLEAFWGFRLASVNCQVAELPELFATKNQESR